MMNEFEVGIVDSDESYIVIVMSLKHGATVAWICDGRETADAILAQWAFDWWGQEFPDEPMPHGDELVQVYFDKMVERRETYEEIEGVRISRRKRE